MNLLFNKNKFYGSIEKIIYIGQNRELFKQNQEKIKYLQDLNQNLKENIDFIQINTLKKRQTNTNEITIKLHEIKCEKEDIRKYFQDFGLVILFTLQLGESCNIF